MKFDEKLPSGSGVITRGRTDGQTDRLYEANRPHFLQLSAAQHQ